VRRTDAAMESMSTDPEPLRYSADLEHGPPGEDADIAAIIAVMRRIAEQGDDRYRHSVRSVHAKNHGIAVGRLEIAGDVPPRLAQGLFAKPGSYAAFVRFSTNPGDLLPDAVSTARGLALKIVGIEGEEMVAGHDGATTQDLLFIDGPTLGAVGPAEFRKQMELFERHLGDPKELKVAVSSGARALQGVLSALGQESATVAALGGHANDHPLGATYYSQVPNRYGDHVAKFSLAPESFELKALAGKRIDVSAFSALQSAIAKYFAAAGGTWLLRVQLAVDLERTPIEDASVTWDEKDAPFETVGRLVLPPQVTDSAERRVYGDDLVAFNPWHAMAAHRPLGGIQRARAAAYGPLSEYRFARNVREKHEPRTAADLPA